MNSSGDQGTEIFLQEAFLHLNFLREYSCILQGPSPNPELLESLSEAAAALARSGEEQGYPVLAEISGKLDLIFRYAQHQSIAPENIATLLEFVGEAMASLESDLLMVSGEGAEAVEDLAALKDRYPFAFQSQTLEPPEALSEGLMPDSPVELSIAPPDGAEPVPESFDQAGEFAKEILEVFVPEAEEHLQTITGCLLALESNPNSEDMDRLFRAMHTLKGSAAQVGLQQIAHVAHRAEDLVGWVRDGELLLDAQIIDLCLDGVDLLKRLLYSRSPSGQEPEESVRSFRARIESLAPAERFGTAQESEDPAAGGIGSEVADSTSHTKTAPAPLQPAGDNVSAATAGVGIEAGVTGKTDAKQTGEPRGTAAAPQSKSVRVPLERLDRMMNAVGELVINRTRMTGRVSELSGLTEYLNFSKIRLVEKLGEFQGKYEFMPLRHPRSALRPQGPRSALAGSRFLSRDREAGTPEFSDLELDRYDDFSILSRSLTEISADFSEVLGELQRFIRKLDFDLDDFSKLAHKLQDEITEARMVPIGNLYMRLSRTVRDAAKAEGKQVTLDVSGAETDLDNGVIQQISDPLIHLVRNAVAHGIETPAERIKRGKAAEGRVGIRASYRGDQVCIEVEDDGRGIDFERVRSTACESSLVSVEESACLGDDELLRLLFKPGFSTAARKTELAGRGVGLDVVRANLEALNGEISVESNPGAGTRFTLRLPLTLIITQALFLRAGKSTLAIPLAFVEEIRRIAAGELEETSGRLIMHVREQPVEVVRLDTQLRLEPIKPVNGFYRIVIVNANGHSVGLLVDEILRKDEIVIKSLGDYLRNIKVFSGATIASDGSLILLIDVNRLIGRALRDGQQSPVAAVDSQTGPMLHVPTAPCLEKVETPEGKAILLVDDSISVRRFVGRMLEKAGYDVEVASDGLEAFEMLSQIRCDLVVTDLEMPRTNGYELMARMRQDPGKRRIPVIVLTSRAGTKHREKAIREGASGFLTKPVQEEKLLETVDQLFGSAKPGLALSGGTA